VWQSFLSIFPHLLGGTMATSQRCCHLPGEMLNSAAECADRAQIGFSSYIAVLALLVSILIHAEVVLDSSRNDY
jgi:hypothetical protein